MVAFINVFFFVQKVIKFLVNLMIGKKYAALHPKKDDKKKAPKEEKQQPKKKEKKEEPKQEEEKPKPKKKDLFGDLPPT